MNNGNGYKDIFWKTIPILATVLIALVGVVWGITFMEMSRRINRMDDIIFCQSESIARIEAKVDVLLEYKTAESAPKPDSKLN